MKKLLTVLLALLMVLTLVGCSSKEEAPIVQEQEQQEEVVEPIEEEPIVGGYIEVEDKNLTPELIEMFEKAFEGLDGANYAPVYLDSTQVVAGTNYKFFCDGTKTTNPIIMGTYYAYINKDLQGNVSLLDIEVIEEHEVKEFKPEVDLDIQIKQDITELYFWVVVYDQFDNELSRTTAKYGTIVKDPNGNDVKVKTNTYFHTYVEYGNSNEEVDNGPKKGDIITLNDGKDYRVLKMDGSNAFVLGLFNANGASVKYCSKVETENFGGTIGVKYQGCDIDNYLENTWYAGLASSQSEMYNAIQPKTISQNMYKGLGEPSAVDDFTGVTYKCQNGTNSYTNFLFIGTATVGERHAYILDVSDIYEYYGKNVITTSELMNVFFNKESATSSTYFRSANSSGANNAWAIFSIVSTIFTVYTDRTNFWLQPAFVIDLAADGIEYTIK